MAYSHDAFPKDQRDQQDTRERQERDGAMADGLILTNEIASKSQLEFKRDGAKPDDLTQTNEKASKREMELSLKA